VFTCRRRLSVGGIKGRKSHEPEGLIEGGVAELKKERKNSEGRIEEGLHESRGKENR